MNNVIVVGAGGVIASELLKENQEYLWTSSDLKSDGLYLDLRKPEDFDYSAFGEGDTVVFLAAISSPDRCKDEFDIAYSINVYGTSYFIEKMLAKNIRVLFFSSDVVYGNAAEAVDELSPISPLGEYAAMKAQVEINFIDNPRFRSLRLSYVLSSEDSFFKYLKICETKGKRAEIFHPFSRKVVDIRDVLDVIRVLVSDWGRLLSPVLNVCGETNVSRKDMADYYRRYCLDGLQYDLVLIDESFWDCRPRTINVISNYLSSILGRRPNSIERTIQRLCGEKK